jgi:hypothetical protein
MLHNIVSEAEFHKLEELPAMLKDIQAGKQSKPVAVAFSILSASPKVTIFKIG